MILNTETSSGGNGRGGSGKPGKHSKHGDKDSSYGKLPSRACSICGGEHWDSKCPVVKEAIVKIMKDKEVEATRAAKDKPSPTTTSSLAYDVYVIHAEDIEDQRHYVGRDEDILPGLFPPVSWSSTADTSVDALCPEWEDAKPKHKNYNYMYNYSINTTKADPHPGKLQKVALDKMAGQELPAGQVLQEPMAAQEPLAGQDPPAGQAPPEPPAGQVPLASQVPPKLPAGQQPPHAEAVPLDELPINLARSGIISAISIIGVMDTMDDNASSTTTTTLSEDCMYTLKSDADPELDLEPDPMPDAEPDAEPEAEPDPNPVLGHQDGSDDVDIVDGKTLGHQDSGVPLCTAGNE